MSGEEWSSFIQSLLYAFDLDPQALANRSRFNPTTVTRWIEDKVLPRPNSRLRLYAAFGYASFEELKERVDESRRAKRLARAESVGEGASSDSELAQMVRLIYLVMEPGSERAALIDEIPFLSELRDEAAKILQGSFKPSAEKLRSNLEVIKSRTA